MGRELPSGKRASQWEGSFLVGRELPSGKKASQWEGCVLVKTSVLAGRELTSGTALPNINHKVGFPVRGCFSVGWELYSGN